LDSIVIIINAWGGQPNEENAKAGLKLTSQRVASCVEFLGIKRFNEAQKVMRKETRIAMHQGGSRPFRKRYGSGQLVAAGRIKEAPRQCTNEDFRTYSQDYQLYRTYYPDRDVGGIVFYKFPSDMSDMLLPAEDVPYRPLPGQNYIEITPNDSRYHEVNSWWEQSCVQ
jgi:hypothetical protein